MRIDGVDPIFMTLSPEEIFFRAFRSAEFDISELSLSSFTVKTAQNDCPYVGIPVFLSRAFRHTAIYVRKDRIKKPEDLKGKKIGLPEYQLTANVWARAILQDDYGVKPSDVTWVRGGIEEPGRPEKIKLNLPPDVKLENAPDGKTISGMLAAGEIDGFIAPRPPSIVEGHPDIGWLFPDPTAAAKDYYKRTGIFPIMHLVGDQAHAGRDSIPGCRSRSPRRSSRPRRRRSSQLSDTSATKVTLPFVEEQLKAARELMGKDFWSYGVAANRKTLDAFLRHHHAQGLSSRLVSAEELFHPATLESFKL